MEQQSSTPTGGKTLPCLICRSRKVRCDRTEPHCRNCIRLGVLCPGYDNSHAPISRSELQKSAEDIFRAAGLQQRRVGSCEECRTSKNRCSRTRPSCRRCLTRGLTCAYPVKYPPRGAHDESSTSPSAMDVERPSVVTAAEGIIVQGTKARRDSLYEAVLPDDPELISRLVNAYFERTHPLRCLAFIHKPSFLQSLDRNSVDQDYGRPLLYVMCALGARSMFLDSYQQTLSPPSVDGTRSHTPGDGWADQARKEILGELHVPTIQHLMALVLLCEYAFRAGQNALVFTLSGCLHRAIRLLGIDAERQSPSLSPHPPLESFDREINNRIVWSSFLIDILVASGVDRNSSWAGNIPQISLPWPDRNFTLQIPPSVPAGPFLMPSIEDEESLSIVGDLDLPSALTILLKLRSDVLRLIRNSPSPTINLWDASSPFMTAIRLLDAFYKFMPDSFHVNKLNMYIHSDQHTIGAVFALNLFFHAAFFDLTRLSLAGFNFPLAVGFADAPPGFRTQVQGLCRFHANKISELIRQGLDYPGRAAFDDPFCLDIAFESAKIQIIHAATATNNDIETATLTRTNLNTNLELLKYLHAGQMGQSRYIQALLPLCEVFGFHDVAEEWRGFQIPEKKSKVEVIGSAGVNHLSNSGTFRLARSELERRSPSVKPATIKKAVPKPTKSASPQAQLPQPSSSTSQIIIPILGNTTDNSVSANDQPMGPTAAGTLPQQRMVHEEQRQEEQPQQIRSQVRNTLHSPPDYATMVPIIPQNTHFLSAPNMASPTQTIPTHMVVPNNGSDMMPTVMGGHPNSMTRSLPVEDYIRAADEMSNYLTWDDSIAAPPETVAQFWSQYNMNAGHGFQGHFE
ncbi:hypothetical protein BX600DRAFT_89412 [Xylariales sp. PMI_506]|nr:hypothetical protein BX600DRAFT_89412 [Xylariales sp. PMI_506]